MRVTVAICTWNRADLLDQTLTRMRELRIPPGVDWELLVVNNNSPDHTDAVIGNHATAGLLPIIGLFEPMQGLSNARNSAVAAARGDLVIWTDDDVLVESDWLERYCQAAASYPKASFFGGSIRPWLPQPIPKWLSEIISTRGYLWALLDHGSTTRELAPSEYVYGANMAFPLWALKRFTFNPQLGHIGNRLGGGDEIAIMDSLRSEGGHGIWIAGVEVDHYIPSDRLSAKYVADRTRLLAAMDSRDQSFEPCARMFGFPRYVVRKYLISRIVSWCLTPTRSARWVRHLLLAARYKGMLDASKHRHDAAT